MRRISIRLGVALLTFFLGVGAAWSYPRLSQPPSTAPESASTPAAASIPDTPSLGAPSEAVKITLARSYRDGAGLIRAEFDVFNGGGEPLLYVGYSSGDNEFWSVRRGSRSKRFSPFCGTGLADRELPPGETVRFQAVIGREAGDVQVGFDFHTREKQLRQTIWSDEINIPES